MWANSFIFIFRYLSQFSLVDIMFWILRECWVWYSVTPLKHMTKNNSKRKGLLHLYTQGIVYQWWRLGRNLRQWPWGRNWYSGYGGVGLVGFLTMPYPVFLYSTSEKKTICSGNLYSQWTGPSNINHQTRKCTIGLLIGQHVRGISSI